MRILKNLFEKKESSCCDIRIEEVKGEEMKSEEVKAQENPKKSCC